MAALPLFFMVLSSTALLLALVALWSSLRQALAAAGGDAAPVEETAELPDRAALLDEKKSLLRAIKDLEYEHAVGKISPEDFKRLDLAYRVRAKEVIALLEQDLAPYQSRAEDLVSHYVGVTVSTAARDEAQEHEHEIAKNDDAKDEEASLRERARALRAEAERLERLATQSDDAKNDDAKNDDAKNDDAKNDDAKNDDAKEST